MSFVNLVQMSFFIDPQRADSRPSVQCNVVRIGFSNAIDPQVCCMAMKMSGMPYVLINIFTLSFI